MTVVDEYDDELRFRSNFFGGTMANICDSVPPARPTIIRKNTTKSFVGVRGSMSPRTRMPITNMSIKTPEMTIIWLILFNAWYIGASFLAALSVTIVFSCASTILVTAPPVTPQYTCGTDTHVR